MKIPKLLFTLAVIMACNVLQGISADTISYQTGNCINNLKSSPNIVCMNGVNFRYGNDSLEIFGTVSANCCGSHLMTIERSASVINIATLDTGLLCLCTCDFCFSLKIKADVTENLVNFNGTLYSTNNQTIAHCVVEPGKTWSVANFPTSWPETVNSYYVKIGPDTIFNDIVYSKLLFSSDSLQTQWSVLGIIRESSKKVYYKENKALSEILLYDFNLNVADSFEVHENVKMCVDSIIEINTRKHFYFSLNNQKTRWIEGIGSIAGLLDNGEGLTMVGNISKLLCCSHYDLTLYKNPDYESCFLLTNIANANSNSFILKQNFPNPFSNNTYIEVFIEQLQPNTCLNIYSLNGILVKKIKIENQGRNIFEINNAMVNKGIWLYNLSVGNSVSEMKKMLFY